MPRRYILMGDIVESSKYDAGKLRQDFMRLVNSCNESLGQSVISPYTVTLGDEFQGVAASLRATLESIFCMEEASLRKGLDFKIRYVALHGEIDTPINRLKAHAMMGSGLTRAREMLNDKRRGQPRFRFDLVDAHVMKQLNRLFLVYDGLIGRWDKEDGVLILDMLTDSNNETVGQKHDKNRSQIWKRRKNLLIEECRALKATILDLGR